MRHCFRRLLPVIPGLILAACTGGLLSYSGGVGTGGTGFVQGSVTGLASVVVDGTELSGATAQYREGNDSEESGTTDSTAVNLGDRLQIELDAQGNPSTVVIEPDLVGTVQPPVTSSTPSFAVNGVPVRVNNDPAAGPVTFYDGLSGYGDIHAGVPVEVHGAYGVDASGDGYILASLIERLPASNSVTRITGAVTNLDTGTGTFQVAGNTILLATDASVLPEGTSLSDGQVVNVWTNLPASNGVFSAEVVRVHTLSGRTGTVQLGGLVSVPSGNRFEIDGITVDAGSPALTAVLSSVNDGDYVVVNGVIDDSSGVLQATAIRTYTTTPAQLELKGTIAGYVDLSHFLVRGVPVDASQAEFTQGTASQLVDGAFVDVFGSVAAGTGNVVTATRVDLIGTPSEGDTVDYRGKVSQVDATTGTFTLIPHPGGSTPAYRVTLAPNAVYANGTAAQLTEGAAVELEATRSTSGLTAYSVAFLPAGAMNYPASSPNTDGIVYDVTAGSFYINGLQIQVNGVMPIGGQLVDGAEADVYFSVSGTTNLAQQILIEN